ncbi:serine hydrolase family protein [Candidatus Woesearchaeota archaeon]|jgi:uncharacterized protein|nr:serine hydrolase family protein [Candidatus Woesearchaeota archaeon]MBT3537926.1 serine hydrolase family protein [Candidatus Woesearchaeota archaeon]MBT4698064.1 serine hydrolase family protein [Candidatus Woesearchaeota archaeon]MBT4716523.1 serine hydrolase family protein [Candidatus Woesearchaeota archaeon]MBT7105595.1 serine hydrolase family protein [Candidatus Woesearchaeota archaeon]
MNNIFLIHGSYGNPHENWFPWLKQELEKLDLEVITPTFPTPENQSLTTWMQAFEPYQDKITNDTIFVGHSLGPAFILNLLQTNKAKAAFFVAPFLGRINNPDFDDINKTFMTNLDWAKIQQNCQNFQIFYSDNDPYVPKEKAKEIANHLNITPSLVTNAGHFNKAAGYTEFKELLEEIKKEIKN